MIYARLKPEKLIKLTYQSTLGNKSVEKEYHFDTKDDFIRWFMYYDTVMTAVAVRRQVTIRVKYHLEFMGLSRSVKYFPTGASLEVR